MYFNILIYIDQTDLQKPQWICFNYRGGRRDDYTTLSLSLSVQKFECNLHQFLGRNLWVTTFPIPFCLIWARQDPTQPGPFSPWNTKHNSDPSAAQTETYRTWATTTDWLTDWLGVWFLLRILWSINDLVLKIKINKTPCFQKHAKPRPNPKKFNIWTNNLMLYWSSNLWCLTISIFYENAGGSI